MFLMISKGPRKSTRSRTKRYRAKLKAKNTSRRGKLFAWKTKKKRTTKARSKKKR